LNGFISEIFIYIGLFKTVIVSNSFVSLIVITALAMVGALALLCFIKVYGAVFLGSPRTVSVKSHESPLSMLVPMVILALLCLTIGLMPMLLSPILDSAISDYAVSAQATSANGVSDYGMRSLPIQSIETLVPLNAIGSMSILLVALILLVAVFMKLRCQYTRKVGTWDCGYSSPTSRIQYTASSFAQMIVEIFHMVLSPHINHPLVDGLFPETTKMHSHVDDIVLDRVAKPLGLRIQIWFGWCRRFQKGVTQHYILYILIVLIVLLSTIIPFNRYILEVFAP
jgi:hydrogenase-4 component B